VGVLWIMNDFASVFVFGHNLIAVVVDLEKWNISQLCISPSQTTIMLWFDSIHLSKSRCMYLGAFAFDLSNSAARIIGSHKLQRCIQASLLSFLLMSHLYLKWGFSLEIDVWRRLEWMPTQRGIGLIKVFSWSQTEDDLKKCTVLPDRIVCMKGMEED
jgi:hypothetical protein